MRTLVNNILTTVICVVAVPVFERSKFLLFAMLGDMQMLPALAILMIALAPFYAVGAFLIPPARGKSLLLQIALPASLIVSAAFLCFVLLPLFVVSSDFDLATYLILVALQYSESLNPVFRFIFDSYPFTDGNFTFFPLESVAAALLALLPVPAMVAGLFFGRRATFHEKVGELLVKKNVEETRG